MVRWSEAEYQALLARRGAAPAPKMPPNGRTRKYGNERVEVDGHRFDSKKEASRYQNLKLAQKAGLVRNLRLQVPFELIARAAGRRARKYVADFVYEELQGDRWVEVVEDTKGFRTAIYKLKRDLMRQKYGIEIRET